MPRLRTIAVTLLLATLPIALCTLFVVGAARAGEQDCETIPREQYSNCAVARAGAQSTTWHAANGDRIVQYYVVPQEPVPVELVQFIAAKDGRRWMEVRDYFGHRPALIVPIGADVWNRLEEKWRHWVRAEGVAAKAVWVAGQLQDKNNAVYALRDHCPWGEIASNLSGSLVALSYACNRSWNGGLIEFLYDTAIDLAPYCRDKGLAFCVRLHGDRALAALAVTAADRMTPEEFDDDKPGASDVFREALAPSARLRFAGVPPVRGAAAFAAAWGRSWSSWKFARTEIDSAVGRKGTVTISGVIVASTNWYPWRIFKAPYRQLWRRAAGGKLLLVDSKIGKFSAPADQ